MTHTDVPPGTAFSTVTVTTARGTVVEVRQLGSGPDLVFFHGLIGLLDREPMLEALARTFTIHAPIWPGYGELENETDIEDMLDFALLGWDIVDALGLDRPHLIGHSFGAMIAAEMACIARCDLERLVLAAPNGLWVDAQPLPDPFAVLPFQLVELLLSDGAKADEVVTVAGSGHMLNLESIEAATDIGEFLAVA